MENVLIIGPSVTDIVQRVRKLPQEGEEIIPLKTEERISGAGYCAAHLFALADMPAFLYTNIGSGIYAEKVRAQLERENIACESRNEETAGCMYTLCDPEGNTVRMAVPGSEYGFLPIGSLNSGRFVFLDGSYLYDETSDLFPEVFTSGEKTVLFAPHYAGADADPDLFRTILESGPWLAMTEEEAAMCGGREKDLRKIVQGLNAVTHQPVIILRTGGSGYYFDGRDEFEVNAGKGRIIDRAGMAEAHTAAFLLAKNAGADNRSAMTFAGECAALAGSSASSVIAEKDRETVRSLLVQAILTESRGGRMQDFLS